MSCPSCAGRGLISRVVAFVSAGPQLDTSVVTLADLRSEDARLRRGGAFAVIDQDEIGLEGDPERNRRSLGSNALRTGSSMSATVKTSTQPGSCFIQDRTAAGAEG